MQVEAHSRDLWNLFLPLESDPELRYGAGLTNLEYAHLAETMGHYLFASEVCSGSLPSFLYPFLHYLTFCDMTSSHLKHQTLSLFPDVYTVEPPNKGYFEANSFVPCKEVVPISEVK